MATNQEIKNKLTQLTQKSFEKWKEVKNYFDDLRGNWRKGLKEHPGASSEPMGRRGEERNPTGHLNGTGD